MHSASGSRCWYLHRARVCFSPPLCAESRQALGTCQIVALEKKTGLYVCERRVGGLRGIASPPPSAPHRVTGEEEQSRHSQFSLIFLRSLSGILFFSSPPPLAFFFLSLCCSSTSTLCRDQSGRSRPPKKKKRREKKPEALSLSLSFASSSSSFQRSPTRCHSGTCAAQFVSICQTAVSVTKRNRWHDRKFG